MGMLLNAGWMRREGKSQAVQGCSVMVVVALNHSISWTFSFFFFPV